MRLNQTRLLPEAHQAFVYFVPFESSSLQQLQTQLIPEEQHRAARFHFEKDAIAWAHYRATLRKILGALINLPPLEVPINYSEYGKPLLDSPWEAIHFNLSHCDHAAVIIVCTDGPVGIDIEPLNRADTLLNCERSFCHPDEIESLPNGDERAMHLLKIWTAKEAALKALGTGLSEPPEKYRLDWSNNSAVLKDAKFPEETLYSIRKLNDGPISEHLIYIATPESVKFIELK